MVSVTELCKRSLALTNETSRAHFSIFVVTFAVMSARMSWRITGAITRTTNHCDRVVLIENRIYLYALVNLKHRMGCFLLNYIVIRNL